MTAIGVVLRPVMWTASRLADLRTRIASRGSSELLYRRGHPDEEYVLYVVNRRAIRSDSRPARSSVETAEANFGA